MSLLKKFQTIQAPNLCFLHSAKGGLSILAYDYVDHFNGPLEDLEPFVKKHKDKLLIGYISYDAALQQHKVQSKHPIDPDVPGVQFLAFENWHEENSPSAKPSQTLTGDSLKPQITPEQYSTSFKNIQQHIQQGDVYQVNLTHQLYGCTNKRAQELFVDIIKQNPANFAAYLGFNNFELLSASPERFIKIEQDQITTQPIKGTIAKTNCPVRNKLNIQTLKDSEKEQAELNMITDLLRNDLNQVCQTNSVKVVKHRAILECPNIYHTYSHIIGRLKVSPIQALISMLPAGSISGCPKKRSLEVIDQQEYSRRGIYTGVIGYIDPNGILDFSIAIRTLLKKGSQVNLGVGGGIVQDSVLQNEYQETLQKAKSFRNIL